MTLEEYLSYRQRIVERDPDAMKKVETKSPPVDATDFTLRVSYVILNSGLRWTVAKDIWTQMKPSLVETGRLAKASGIQESEKRSTWRCRTGRSFFGAFTSAWANGSQGIVLADLKTGRRQRLDG